MGPPEVIHRIVVGVDGSEHSLAALEWAIRMARGMHAQVIAVYAIHEVDPYATAYGIVPPAAYDPDWRRQVVEEFRNDWCRPLAAAGVAYTTVVEDGQAASVIAKVAEEKGADVIVVGRRGRGHVRELLLGSVSHELALHSRVPLLLIPPPERHATA